MSLIGQEIKELRDMMKDFRTGKIKAEEVNTCLGIYSQTEKRIGHTLKAVAMASTVDNSAGKMIDGMGLIGEDELEKSVIGSAEDEVIHCPEQKKNITRAGCLDFSGEEKHEVCCRNCPNYTETRKILLPPVE